MYRKVQNQPETGLIINLYDLEESRDVKMLLYSKKCYNFYKYSICDFIEIDNTDNIKVDAPTHEYSCFFKNGYVLDIPAKYRFVGVDESYIGRISTVMLEDNNEIISITVESQGMVAYA